MKGYKLIAMATLLAAVTMMLTSSCMNDNEAHVVFYQTQDDALNLKALCALAGEDASTTTMTLYVEGTKLSTTMTLDTYCSDLDKLDCSGNIGFPTYTIKLGIDKEKTCTLKIVIAEGTPDADSVEMQFTVQADKCNTIYIPLKELFFAAITSDCGNRS